MTWVRLDDQFFRHPKSVEAGRDAKFLFIAGLCYCATHLTDGHIPANAVRLIAADAEVKPTAAKKLLEIGLWSQNGNNYIVHDYLRYQPSRESVQKHREEVSEVKSRAGKKGAQARWGHGKPDGITNSKPIADASHSDSKRDGIAMAPSHPIPISPSPLDEDDGKTDVFTLIATRQANLRNESSDPVEQPARWIPTVANDLRNRLTNQAHQLEAANPDWTTERLADELDPQTATEQHSIPTAEQTRTWLDQRAAIVPTPMPEHLRRRAR